MRAIAASANLFDHILSIAVLWQASQNETSAFSVKALRNRAANSLRRTSYNCDFASQSLHHKSLSALESQHKPHVHATEGAGRRQNYLTPALPRRDIGQGPNYGTYQSDRYLAPSPLKAHS